MLWNRSLVMYDVDTKSHWSHILGQSMDGEMKGTALEMLPSEMTTWKAWREAHPNTSVLNMSRTHKGFTADFYKDPAQFVYGWATGRKRYHVSVADLRENPIRNLTLGSERVLLTFDPEGTNGNLFSRTLDERELKFTAAGDNRMRDEQTGSLWDAVAGTAIDGPLKGKRLERRLGMLSYRRAWNDFYPSSVDPLTEN